IGNQTRIKVVKNKLAPPFREIEFDITYGEGVSREGMLIDLGVAVGVIDKAGAWLSFQGDRIGQGRENAKIFLRDNDDISQKIEALVLERHGLKRETGEAAEGDGANGKPVQAVQAVPKPVREKKSSRRR
ncbi:MAG: DNA recombination/repair protein RecA, partial [Myxococcales bacterium]|nr:DNA recombination/repair protein RecA [Myxococcales bacterium]